MTPLSPERLEELAAAVEEVRRGRGRSRNKSAGGTTCGCGLYIPYPDDGWAGESVTALVEAHVALRAGAAAWRIAVEMCVYRAHYVGCGAVLADHPGPCTCGLHALEQRLAALGGEVEQ